MDINKKLVSFAQQGLVLAHNDTERDKINNSLSHLEKVILSSNIGVKEFIRFGSFTRNTILPRKYDSQSDVDLMVVFNTSITTLKPDNYRQKLYDVVSKAYPLSMSKKDFPVVKLELNHIMFDVVPAYHSVNWYSSSYYIPDKGNTWRASVPNDINRRLQDVNQRFGNNTVRNVIRLCKHWNASKSYPLESYLMEKRILDLNFYGNDTFAGFVYALENIAYNNAGVRQAIDYIKLYKGDWYTPGDTEKQYQWVQKLLPGLL